MAEELAGPSVFSFNLTVETPIDIDQMIYMLSPQELPFVHGILSDGLPALPQSAAGDVNIYWLEETVPLPRSVLLNAIPDAVATTSTLASGQAVKFRVGDAIKIENEILLVTGINTTTEVITFTRGSAALTNTTAAAHPAGAEVLGIGSVQIEGSLASFNYQGRDKYYNIMQIFTGKLNMSGTEQAISKYGVASELAHQMANTSLEFGVGIEQAALYGVRFQHATDFHRQMGGLNYYIASNADATEPWLTVDVIEDAQQRSFDLGGPGFDFVMAQPQAFMALNNTLGNERITTQDFMDPRRGRRRARTIITAFGELDLVWNRYVKRNDAFALRKGQVGLRKLRPMQTFRLGKTDDTDSFGMVMECSLQVKGEAHMAKWSALDSTQLMPADLV